MDGSDTKQVKLWIFFFYIYQEEKCSYNRKNDSGLFNP
jgi:hypothetical protein